MFKLDHVSQENRHRGKFRVPSFQFLLHLLSLILKFCLPYGRHFQLSYLSQFIYFGKAMTSSFWLFPKTNEDSDKVFLGCSLGIFLGP